MHQTKTQIFGRHFGSRHGLQSGEKRNLCCKIYNDENKDISIPKIYLESGIILHFYRINVDGKAGTEFTNVPLRKKTAFIFL